MAMNSTEMKSTARANTVALLKPVLDENEAVQFADASWAILQEVDGQEIWCEVTVKTKAYKATKVSEVFDPYEVAQAWQQEKEVKAAEKAAKAAEKGKKVTKKKEEDEG